MKFFISIFRFTFECHVDTPIQPEVTWYKDNLPLNSPDYETKYSNGVATLTIEETFSEDTARYTVKFTTYIGHAESSAHLTVRGKTLIIFKHLLYRFINLGHYT